MTGVPRIWHSPPTKCLLLESITYLQSDSTVLFPTLSLAGDLFHLWQHLGHWRSRGCRTWSHDSQEEHSYLLNGIMSISASQVPFAINFPCHPDSIFNKLLALYLVLILGVKVARRENELGHGTCWWNSGCLRDKMEVGLDGRICILYFFLCKGESNVWPGDTPTRESWLLNLVQQRHPGHQLTESTTSVLSRLTTNVTAPSGRSIVPRKVSLCTGYSWENGSSILVSPLPGVARCVPWDDQRWEEMKEGAVTDRSQDDGQMTVKEKGRKSPFCLPTMLRY